MKTLTVSQYHSPDGNDYTGQHTQWFYYTELNQLLLVHIHLSIVPNVHSLFSIRHPIKD